MLKRILLLLPAVLIAAPLHAQDGDWKKTLEASLEEVYKPVLLAKKGITRSRTGAVETPGTILVIQQPGILADGGNYGVQRMSTVRNGALTKVHQQADDRQYLFKVGDKAWVEKVDVDDNSVAIRILTLEPIERVLRGTTISDRFRAVIKFDFEKGTLASIDAAEVQKVIAPFLMSEAEASAPKTIAIGQTIEEVKKILGSPKTIIDLGSKKTYVYENMRVIFVDGKVSDVQ